MADDPKQLRDLYSAKTLAPGAGKAVLAVPRSAARPRVAPARPPLAVARNPVAFEREQRQRAKASPMSAMEEQLLSRYGLQPGIHRPGIVPLARNPETGSIEFTAPQFVYDAARAFEAPGMVLAGNKVDLPEEAQNFAVNFTGGGLGAGRLAAPLEEGAVLGMAGARKVAPAKTSLAAKTAQATEAPPVRLEGAPSDFMVSTRRPSEANYSTFGNPDAELILQSGDAMKMTPEGFAKNMAQLTEAPFMSDMVGASPDAIYDAATRRGADNLKFIAEELMPEDAARRAVNWYPTAHDLGIGYANRIGKPPQAGWGALAVTSPQTPWPVNVARVDRMTQMMDDNFDVDPEGLKRWLAERTAMAEKGRNPGAVFSQGQPYMQRIIETPFSELGSDMDRYSRIVLADASRFPNRVKNITPEGEFTEDFGPMTWGSSREIGSALNIMNDPSMANIRAQLTGGGKVPSFFNDIAAPYTGLPTATMDTHSTGAYSLFPGGGKDPIVYRGMGLGRPTTDLPPAAYSSSATGSKGLYGAMVDAHDLARKELGLDRTNAVQSVTWEGVRDLWGENAKTPALKRAIEEIQRANASNPDQMRFSVAELLGRPVRRVFQVK